MGFSEIQLCGEVAVDIEAHGCFHELLCNAEAFRQVPDLTAAFGHRFVPLVLGAHPVDGPAVGTVFMALAQVIG